MVRLVISDNEGSTTVVPLLRDEVTIGRKEGNTIRLTERNISRRHVQLVRVAGIYKLRDLDSYNGDHHERRSDPVG
jgi:ABC transport system ATP-binding/permease protein